MWLLLTTLMAATPSATPVARTERFEFRAEPRANLYHLLLNWAWADLGEAPPWQPAIPEREVELATLPTAVQARWKTAAATFASRVSKRSPTFDDGLGAVRAHLAGEVPLSKVPGADRVLVKAVERVLPDYLERWWPKHRADAEAWMNALLPVLRDAEPELTRRLAAAYGGAWPKARVPVEVVEHAVPVGAYSMNGRVTMSSTRRGYEMPWAVEMVLHESSHVQGLEAPLRARLERAFASVGTPMPEGLVHDVIFFTSGEVTRLVLATQVPDYRHYGEASGMYGRDPARWNSLRPRLERTWGVFLAEGGDADAALRRFAQTVSGTPDGG